MAKSKVGLAVQQPINEVRWLQRPAFRYLVFFYLYLSRKHFLPYLLTGTTMEGPSSEHHLMGNDSNSEIVSRVWVILPTQNFGRHIARGPTCITIVIRTIWPCNSQVSYPCVSLSIKYDILRLYVPVDYSLWVQVPQTQHYTDNQKLRLLFIEFLSWKVMP